MDNPLPNVEAVHIEGVVNHSPNIIRMSQNSNSCSSTSSASSSPRNLNIQQDRRSNITILSTDSSSSDNWTLRRHLNIASATRNYPKRSKSFNASVHSIENAPNDCIDVPINDACNTNPNATEGVEKFEEKIVPQEEAGNKDIVRIRKASKYYGPGDNKQQVLCSLDLTLREGDM